MQKIKKKMKVAKKNPDWGFAVGFIIVTSIASAVMMSCWEWEAIWGWIAGVLTVLAWVCFYTVVPKKK